MFDKTMTDEQCANGLIRNQMTIAGADAEAGLAISSLLLPEVFSFENNGGPNNAIEKAITKYWENNKHLGVDSKLFGNNTLGDKNLPPRPTARAGEGAAKSQGGVLNNSDNKTKLGWGKSKGSQVIRLSATWLPLNKVNGFGHFTIWVGSLLRRVN
jgi:hypothetical protein